MYAMLTSWLEEMDGWRYVAFWSQIYVAEVCEILGLSGEGEEGKTCKATFWRNSLYVASRPHLSYFDLKTNLSLTICCYSSVVWYFGIIDECFSIYCLKYFLASWSPISFTCSSSYLSSRQTKFSMIGALILPSRAMTLKHTFQPATEVLSSTVIKTSIQ